MRVYEHNCISEVPTIFLFDLDGTITKQETLPLISNHFHVAKEISELTKKSVKGNIPFIEGFIRRVNILGTIPVQEVALLLNEVELYAQVLSFIKDHSDHCVVVTGNLRCWIEVLLARIGCKYYCSEAILDGSKIKKISKILKKESVVEQYKARGYKVVFIGEGNNDVEAMRLADVSIASALTHTPANGCLLVADYYVQNEKSLCRLLNQLL